MAKAGGRRPAAVGGRGGGDWAGRYAGGVASVSETAAMTGSERVQAAIKAESAAAAPSTAVGFGRDP